MGNLRCVPAPGKMVTGKGTESSGLQYSEEAGVQSEKMKYSDGEIPDTVLVSLSLVPKTSLFPLLGFGEGLPFYKLYSSP